MNVVVLITCANRKEAKRISRHLVEQKLVACVNIVDKVSSVFWWQKKVDSANEVLLIAKSDGKNHQAGQIPT
jgi:periplasmic divalent cation tolerance protein